MIPTLPVLISAGTVPLSINERSSMAKQLGRWKCSTSLIDPRDGAMLRLSVRSKAVERQRVWPRKRDGSKIERNPQRPSARPARAKLVASATAAACGDHPTLLPS
jgi:hypothetical protein